jgi:hypothetical protein
LIAESCCNITGSRLAAGGFGMNRLPVAMILALALAGCAGAPPPRQPVAAHPASCTGGRFHEGTKTYARCIRHVASPPYQMRQIRAAMREHRMPMMEEASSETGRPVENAPA